MTAAVRDPRVEKVARILDVPAVPEVLGAVGAALVATIGFRSVFGGPAALVAIALGVVVAGVIGGCAIRWRWSHLTLLVADIAAFVLVAVPVAAPDDATGGVLPSPAGLSSAIDALVHGWRELPTLSPPVTDARHLVVLPLFCSFVSVALSLALSRLKRVPILAVAPPVIVLGLVTAEGTASPFSLVVQGGVLVIVLLLWAKRLQPRATTTIGHFGGANKLAGTSAMLLVMALAAPLVGPHLPFVGGSDRYLLRDHIDVPFDPNDYPSPLSQFRSYRRDKKLKAKDQAEFQKHELLTVSGLPGKAMLRFAVMTDYDGVVWRVSSDTSPNPFVRAAGTLSAGAPGEMHRVKVTVPSDGLGGVWLPLAGTPTTIDFAGPRAKELTDAFRYSQSMDAGAVIGGLAPGDSYAFSASFPQVGRDCDVDSLGSSTLGAVSTMPRAVGERAQKVLQGKGKRARTVREQIDRIHDALDGDNGYYGDGDTPYREPGHYSGLLEDFVSATSRLGNDEQYAAAAALYARANAIPARVVVGATPEVGKDGTAVVRRRDVRAWIEVPDSEGRWIPCEVTPKRDDDDYKQLDPPPDPKPNVAPRVIIPPYPPQADDLGDLANSTAGRRTKVPPTVEEATRSASGALRFIAWSAVPVVLIGGPIGLILLLKDRRRRKRRTTGAPVVRMVGAWKDVTDLTRDLGWAVAANATRLEVAAMHGQPEMVELATLLNGCTFGPEPAESSTVTRSWEIADGLRSRLLGGLRRSERIRAALSLTSLRRGT